MCRPICSEIVVSQKLIKNYKKYERTKSDKKWNKMDCSLYLELWALLSRTMNE